MSDTRIAPRRRNERFITVLPIDPTHAWVFWELLPGDGDVTVVVRDVSGCVLFEQSPADPAGDTFVTLPHAGAVIEATLVQNGAMLTDADPLPLPADRPGHSLPALRKVAGSSTAGAAPRAFVAQAPPGSMYNASQPASP